MKKATLLVYVLTLSFYSFAQEKVLSKRSYNNFFAEAWGVTGWYSVNYERLIWRSPHNVFIASVAVGYSNLAHRGVRHITYPMRLMVSIGKKHLFAEAGYDLIFDKSKADGFLHPWVRKSACKYLHIGVRYQPLHSGFYIRGYAFAVPLQRFAIPLPYPEPCDGIFYHLNRRWSDLEDAGKKNLWWGGIGIGWSFGR